MVLDSEKQKDLILTMIRGGTFTGDCIDQVYDLKKAVEKAILTSDNINPPSENDKTE